MRRVWYCLRYKVQCWRHLLSREGVRVWVAEWMDARHPTLCRAALLMWALGDQTFRQALDEPQICRPCPTEFYAYCGKCANNRRGWPR